MNFETILHQLSEMGQKEMARSPAASAKLLLSAGGAGLITVLTVVIKAKILLAPLSLVAGGFFGMLNFVASFLFMQACDFRLATKQSPLLGAAIGRRFLGPIRSYRKLKDELRCSVRTQLLSSLGNLFFVTLGALLFHLSLVFFTGSPLFKKSYALYSIQSLHPLSSGSIAYAALTGCIIWACSVMGSAIANGFKPFSKASASAFFNLGLGAALAFVPIIGKVTGLGLEVRHFTLSGGMLTIASASLGLSQALKAGLLEAFVGVLAIGLMNFSVSFALAFLFSGAGGFKDRMSSPSLIGPLPMPVPAC